MGRSDGLSEKNGVEFGSHSTLSHEKSFIGGTNIMPAHVCYMYSCFLTHTHIYIYIYIYPL
jgi:hypothetical protein